MKATLLLLAAGKAERMGSLIEDKALACIDGTPAFIRSLKAFAASGQVQEALLVCRTQTHWERYDALLQSSAPPLPVRWCLGGASRQMSVLRGLECLGASENFVFVHDVARCLVHPESIRGLGDACKTHAAAALGHPVGDTLQRKGDANLSLLARENLWAMETPQLAKAEVLLNAYRAAQAAGLEFADCSSVLAHHGVSAELVENPYWNPKLTRAQDVAFMEALARTLPAD